MPTRFDRLRHFLEVDIHAWQYCVLALCGLTGAMAGLTDWRLSRHSTTVAAAATVEELEAGVPDNRHRSLGRHVPIGMWVGVLRRANSTELERVYYPVVSPRSWDRAVEEAQARHPVGTASNADIWSLLKIRVVVRTRRFVRSEHLNAERLHREGLTGLLTDEQEAREAFTKALQQMKDFRPEYRVFPQIDEDRLLVLEEGRTPRPRPLAAAEIFAGAVMILTGCLGILAHRRRRRLGRFAQITDVAMLAQAPESEVSLRVARRWNNVAALALLAALLSISIAGDYETDMTLAASAFFSLLLVLAPAARRRGSRHAAAAAQALLARDARAPVLYLRSFADDMTTAQDPDRGLWSYWLFTLLSPLRFLFTVLESERTEEDHLAEALGGIGPVVAIGRPGEPLPETGAIRVYVSQAEWQDKVREYMAAARLVVLRLGATAGFRWEFERSARDLDPTKLALLVPFDRGEYDRFRRESAALFPHPLPDYEEHWFYSLRGLGTLRGLIFFEPGWRPRFVELARAKPDWGHALRFVLQRKLLARLNWALRPVYAQVGVSWKPPPVTMRIWAWAAVIAAFVVGIAIGGIAWFVTAHEG